MPFLSGAIAKIITLGLGADLLLFSGLILASLIFTVFFGRRRVLLYLMAVYVTLAVLAFAPFIGRFSEINKSSNQTIFFVIAFVALFFILARGVLGQVFTKGGYVYGWWQGVLLAFFQLGLLVSIFMYFLPSVYLNIFSSFTKTVFLDPWGRFAWFVAPIILMAALGSKDND